MAVSSVSTSFHPMRHPPFRVCGRGNQKQQAFYVPRRLPEEARPPALADNTLTPPKRQDQYNMDGQISQSGDKNRNSLPKNFVLPVDKSGRWVYYKCNITKMAVKRRVGLRIDPYQKARAMEKGGKQEAENGLGAVRARRMSAKSATGAPVTASGCKQHCCRSIEAVPVRVW